MELNLQRPLLFFDIESTGLSITNDSIIELSFVKIMPSSEQIIKTWRVKPWDYIAAKQRPINPEATKVHGITDDMLASEPTFYELADEIASWLVDVDFAGFNSTSFDLPMLSEEFERAKLAGKEINIDLHEPRMVDVQSIYHRMEPRTLTAAYRFYCDRDLKDAHSAEADTLATYEVLKAQLERYEHLKNDVAELAKMNERRRVDFSGMLSYNDAGEVIIAFGKHKGKTLREIVDKEPSYCAWVQQSNFTLDTKAQFAKYEQQYKLEKLRDKFGSGKLF